jgi:hypothetical protein
MDIETETTDMLKKPNLVTKRICKRIEEKMEELETNYTEFYWYLWEQDSGNCSS